jgi:hypothetical protein
MILGIKNPDGSALTVGLSDDVSYDQAIESMKAHARASGNEPIGGKVEGVHWRVMQYDSVEAMNAGSEGTFIGTIGKPPNGEPCWTPAKTAAAV